MKSFIYFYVSSLFTMIVLTMLLAYAPEFGRKAESVSEITKNMYYGITDDTGKHTVNTIQLAGTKLYQGKN